MNNLFVEKMSVDYYTKKDKGILKFEVQVPLEKDECSVILCEPGDLCYELEEVIMPAIKKFIKKLKKEGLK